MSKKIEIATDQAPAAIGTYSQAVRTGTTVYLSGQIPLDPATQKIVDGGFDAQVDRAQIRPRQRFPDFGSELLDDSSEQLRRVFRLGEHTSLRRRCGIRQVGVGRTSARPGQDEQDG